MSFSSSEKDFSAVFRLVSTWRLHRKFIWIGILGRTFLGVFHRQIKVKNRTESCSHINLFPPQILVLISWMVSFIIFDGVCSVGSQRAVYMRENKPRTARVNGTKSMFTAYSTQGQLKPRLILAEGFWYGLIQAAAHLGRESVRINALKRCPRLAEAVNDCCACSVFNYIPDLHGRETCVAVAGKWVLFTFTKWKMVDRDSCKKRNVWSAPEKKQILLICSELEIAGQLDVYVTSASVSSPILILNLRLLKVQPGREQSREPFLRAVRV